MAATTAIERAREALAWYAAHSESIQSPLGDGTREGSGRRLLIAVLVAQCPVTVQVIVDLRAIPALVRGPRIYRCGEVVGRRIRRSLQEVTVPIIGRKTALHHWVDLMREELKLKEEMAETRIPGELDRMARRLHEVQALREAWEKTRTMGRALEWLGKRLMRRS